MPARTPDFETVVVTGAAGGMGAAVVADLLARGYAVAALDLPAADPWEGRTPTEETAEALAAIGRGAASGRLTYRRCCVTDAAGVTRRGEVTGVGIDAEPHLPLPADVADLTLTPPERRRVAEWGAAVPGIAWDRVVFSLKEATYKLWHPLRREWLGFEEVDAVVHTDGTFTVELPRPLPTPDGEVRLVRGRWAVTDGLLLTAATLASAPLSPQRWLKGNPAGASCPPGRWWRSARRPG